jgi:hypothetical protein
VEEGARGEGEKGGKRGGEEGGMLMMMINFFLFLHKQKIADRYIPVWVHLREIEEKTRLMMLLSCSLWYHDASDLC